MVTIQTFLQHFPQFGGLDVGTLDSAMAQAIPEYDPMMDNYTMVTLNLMAHILMTRAMGISESVEMMSAAQGVSGSSRGSSRGSSKGSAAPQWKGDSLGSTPYGQEVQRLLIPNCAGLLFIP